eukprot:CAMPEP_0181211170 /NCGR_PEP_ID=MMETSP1096-20121128/23636_1 /TAXON_ID=156174 ORGANISM="Chrysochromulina ericina, Strain CCMP281" /NCGR_SAMPLE_ID=MMETSP1096 /ASSEMBLY_ACC=CAM_ASM_000453 /LENGTH=89 /DNA_ID=CAMNT_0023302539 /DNA_START=494 /DNA_END=763 /DNA_ORIENTATION=+
MSSSRKLDVFHEVPTPSGSSTVGGGGGGAAAGAVRRSRVQAPPQVGQESSNPATSSSLICGELSIRVTGTESPGPAYRTILTSGSYTLP